MPGGAEERHVSFSQPSGCPNRNLP